jgi:aminoglycoside 6-adenylyltransferase
MMDHMYGVLMKMRCETEILSQINRWAQDEPLVRAVILTGSRADPKGRPDSLSDYDIALYVNDWKQFQENDNWLKKFGTIMVRWPLFPLNTFDSNWLTRLVLFDDGVRIDFQITEARHIGPNEYDGGYRVLIDKDGVTGSIEVPTFTVFNITKPSRDEFETLCNDFWWDATYVPKYLLRNELPFAKYMLDDVLRFNYLHRLVEWYIGSQYDWSVNTGSHGKWFSRYLDKETWAAYRTTYAGAEIEENWYAFFRLGDLFGRLAVETAEYLGYSYSENLGKNVTEYAANLRQTYD